MTAAHRSSQGLKIVRKMFLKIALIATIFTAIASQRGYGRYGHHEGPFEPKPYSFGYAIKDTHGEQTRHESSDGSGRVTGSYSFIDEKGIERIVQYIADHLGFRAKIITNEPGTANQNPAGVIMESRQG